MHFAKLRESAQSSRYDIECSFPSFWSKRIDIHIQISASSHGRKMIHRANQGCHLQEPYGCFDTDMYEGYLTDR